MEAQDAFEWQLVMFCPNKYRSWVVNMPKPLAERITYRTLNNQDEFENIEYELVVRTQNGEKVYFYVEVSK